MKRLIVCLAITLVAASPAFADVQLTMRDGRVSIVAKDATVRQILTEWARVGHTRIVNVDKIPGGPITIELTNVTEMQALDVLLRSLSGYIAAPRAVEVANLSSFDSIFIMPTVAAARVEVPASPMPPPVFAQQQAGAAYMATPLPPVEDRPQEEPPPSNEGIVGGIPPGSVPPQMRVQVDRFQRSQEVSRQGVLPNGVIPKMPTGPVQQTFGSAPLVPFGGVAVPGMVAPTPGAAPGRPAGQ